MEFYEDLGPELILNHKYLDSYRYRKSQAYLYDSLMQWTYAQYSWKRHFDQRKPHASIVSKEF